MKEELNNIFEKVLEHRKKEDPLRKTVMRIFDANIDTPDIFFKMDEIGDDQVLRKYDKSSGEVKYAGTYKILYKTDRRDKFYLIMTRIKDEAEISKDILASADEFDAWIVCRYEPGVKGRIYLFGLPEETIESITEEYAKKMK